MDTLLMNNTLEKLLFRTDLRQTDAWKRVLSPALGLSSLKRVQYIKSWFEQVILELKHLMITIVLCFPKPD